MNFIMQRAIFFIVLMMLWYVCFPNILLSMEENAFWTDAPDMTNVMYHLPADWAEIASNYLAQYFSIAFIGACVMAVLPTIVLLATDVIVWQLFRNRRLQCLSFIPAFVVAIMFMGDGMLTRYIQAAAIAMLIAAVLFLCTIKRWVFRFEFHSRPFLLLTNILPYVLIVIMAVVMMTSSGQKEREFNSHIEHLTQNRAWDELFDATYPVRNELNDNQMAYSLLALSQKGLMGERLFHYPIKGLENIFAHSKNFRFNSYFCHELGFPNEAIRYAFEEGQYMPSAASFGTMRRMVDWLIEKGDDPELVDFYLNLLQHSSCHDNFIQSRRVQMLQPVQEARHFEPEFVGSPSFLYEASLKLEQEPTNTIARDYLLCGMLVLGNVEAFYKLLNDTYVQTDDEKIPTHYLEALAMLSKAHPEIPSTYQLPNKVRMEYQRYAEMMTKNPVVAKKEYSSTYWAYYTKLKETSGTQIKIIDSNLMGGEFGN